jgi:putative transcriptional regulator
VSAIWIRRAVLLGLVSVLLPAGLDAALPKQELTPQQAPSLTGQLLIASPRIGDPRFGRTVILVVRHDKKGALGITLNRPLGVRTLKALLDGLDGTGSRAPRADAATVRILSGGPVEPETGFVVHSAEYGLLETLRVTTDVSVTASLDVLRDIARNKGPRKALVALGYAGWAAGQLESELARDDWLVVPADAALVFDVARERVWDEAMARRVP